MKNIHKNILGLTCKACGQEWPEKKFRLSCPDCSSPLEVIHDLSGIRRYLKTGWPKPHGVPLLKQWEKLLPISHPELIIKTSLGETQTPLVQSKAVGPQLGLDDLRFKVEIGPTLSLKDRGTSLCALKAVELGFEAMCVASSGNNAGSVAAYAARAGLPSIVFVQRTSSPAKLAKIVNCGARLVRVDGDMSMASKLCGQIRELHHWMESGGPNPYRMAAKRLVAYEITTQMEGQVPDTVLFPCGGSAGIAAAHMGFCELKEMGLIERLPKLIGVQLSACAPVARAFEKGLNKVAPVNKKPSFSDALMNNSPYWGDRAIMAARETGGAFISVSDQEVQAMLYEMGRTEGFFLEPAGVVAVAGLKKLVRQKLIAGITQVVCTLTGHGLNALKSGHPEKTLPDPLPPDPEYVNAYLKL